MPIEESSASRALRDSLRELINGGLAHATLDERATLRTHVEAYVDELRGRNEQPEHVLIAIKRLMVAAGLDVTSGQRPDVDTDADATEELRRSMIAWMIERYYSGKPAGES